MPLATLLRLLGGLDNNKMVGVLEAYERKYGKPLASALNQEIGGNFARAAPEPKRPPAH